MIDFPYLNEICRKTDSRIVLLVVDGLGGLPHPQTGRSELETANTPNLDALASRSACGVTTPVAPGITPGSGPGHLALFGYDPLKYVIGRGVLEALGIGIDLGPDDIAIRCNFCTLDSNGILTDRRAGRIPTAESAPLVEQLSNIAVPGVEIMVRPVQDYRFVVVIRGEDLGGDVTDTDPQRTGFAPLDPAGRSDAARRTARKAARFIESARDILGSRDIANMILMRGFSRRPDWPAFGDAYSLNPGAVAAYPMYRGIASLLGMSVIPTGHDFDAELDTLSHHWGDHDFFFLHYKPADAAGEDGDFDAKVRTLEELDLRIPRLLDMGADVVAVAGDHSTPSSMAAHSWHPVPMLINSDSTNEGLGSPGFNERACRSGYMGSLHATSLPLLLLAHAGKLDKFGA
jgi:2,3-bisphosphoglycerate-independent phosphoglycerate mutase